MTVCAAALFSVSTGEIGVLGVSDRMLTVPPDIQYEPHQEPKIYYLTNSIQIMTAGDSAMQADVLSRVRKEAFERIDLDPEEWFPVREVAEIYSEAYTAERLARAEIDVLRPLFLNAESWVDRQQELAPNLVPEIAKELYRFQAPTIAAIIVGVDDTGPHIYVVRNSSIACHDKVGFAAIGVGTNHAGSEFMFAGHSRYKLYPTTLLLAHRAKKRAEVAPGVGKETDMFFIGPAPGTFTRLPASMITYLDDIFAASEKEKRSVTEKSEEEINVFFEELRAQHTKDQEQEKGSEGDGEGDGEGEAEGVGDGPADDERNVRKQLEAGEPEDGESSAPS